MVLRALVSIFACALLAGCPDAAAPPAGNLDGGDAGGGIDALDPYVDSDDDGLCNSTEFVRGTDPFAVDSDGDGYSDWMEVSFGFNPTLPASPDRTIVATMTEAPEAGAEVRVSVFVRGRGEDYAGAFEGLPARDPELLTAVDFFSSAIALHASPPDHVVSVEPEAQIFRLVRDETELVFEVRFQFGDNLERRCLRAYPWRYTVKRSDGPLVAAERFILVIVPQGETFRSAEWCAPTPPCI